MNRDTLGLGVRGGKCLIVYCFLTILVGCCDFYMFAYARKIALGVWWLHDFFCLVVASVGVFMAWMSGC